MTRRLLFPISLLLWVAALAYRFGTYMDEDRGEDSYLMLGLCLTPLLGYVVFRIAILVTDTQWQWGWRK